MQYTAYKVTYVIDFICFISLYRYDIQTQRTLRERPIRQADFHGKVPYHWGGNSDMDFAVDETGLWLIYRLVGVDTNIMQTQTYLSGWRTCNIISWKINLSDSPFFRFLGKTVCLRLKRVRRLTRITSDKKVWLFPKFKFCLAQVIRKQKYFAFKIMSCQNKRNVPIYVLLQQNQIWNQHVGDSWKWEN